MKRILASCSKMNDVQDDETWPRQVNKTLLVLSYLIVCGGVGLVSYLAYKTPEYFTQHI